MWLGRISIQRKEDRMSELQPCKCYNIPHLETEEMYSHIGFMRGKTIYWYVKCDRCGKTFGDFLSRDSAIQAWNREVRKWYK